MYAATPDTDEDVVEVRFAEYDSEITSIDVLAHDLASRLTAAEKLWNLAVNYVHIECEGVSEQPTNGLNIWLDRNDDALIFGDYDDKLVKVPLTSCRRLFDFSAAVAGSLALLGVKRQAITVEED